MYRSKLETCVAILCALASNGPMRLIQLMTKLELNKPSLISHLRLLRNRGLIEKQNLEENKIFYVVTERGLTVLKVINPIIKEAYKIQMRNFEAISSVLSGAKFTSGTTKDKRPILKKLSDFIKIEVVKEES